MAGLFGVGGAVILIPLLAFFLKVDQHRAQGLALAALLLPNGLPAVLHYRRQGVPIHWRLVGLLTIGFMIGVWLGALLANRIPEAPLRYGFAGLLVFLALKTAFIKGPERTGMDVAPNLEISRIWLSGILIGLAGGLASGLLGIGGAILMNPLMVSRLRLPQHQAQVTSLALMLAPIGLPGVIVYVQAQHGLPWLILSGLALGFMMGAYGGAKMATRIKGPRLRLIFASVMAFMALLLLFRG
jgi:uncharacterized membrane protein YfcA